MVVQGVHRAIRVMRGACLEQLDVELLVPVLNAPFASSTGR